MPQIDFFHRASSSIQPEIEVIVRHQLFTTKKECLLLLVVDNPNDEFFQLRGTKLLTLVAFVVFAA